MAGLQMSMSTAQNLSMSPWGIGSFESGGSSGSRSPRNHTMATTAAGSSNGSLRGDSKVVLPMTAAVTVLQPVFPEEGTAQPLVGMLTDHLDQRVRISSWPALRLPFHIHHGTVLTLRLFRTPPGGFPSGSEGSSETATAGEQFVAGLQVPVGKLLAQGKNLQCWCALSSDLGAFSSSSGGHANAALKAFETVRQQATYEVCPKVFIALRPLRPDQVPRLLHSTDGSVTAISASASGSVPRSSALLSPLSCSSSLEPCSPPKASGLLSTLVSPERTMSDDTLADLHMVQAELSAEKQQLAKDLTALKADARQQIPSSREPSDCGEAVSEDNHSQLFILSPLSVRDLPQPYPASAASAVASAEACQEDGQRQVAILQHELQAERERFKALQLRTNVETREVNRSMSELYTMFEAEQAAVSRWQEDSLESQISWCRDRAQWCAKVENLQSAVARLESGDAQDKSFLCPCNGDKHENLNQALQNGHSKSEDWNWRAEFMERESEVMRSRTLYHDLHRRHEVLEQQHEALQTQSLSCVDLSEHEALRAMHDQLEQRLEAQQQEFGAISPRMAALSKDLEDFEFLRNDREILQQKFDVLQTELAELRATSSKDAALSAEHSELKERCDSLQNEMDAARRKDAGHMHLQKKLEALAKEHEELALEHRDLKMLNSDAEDAAALRAQESFNDWQRKYETLEAALQTLQDKHASLQQTHDELRSRPRSVDLSEHEAVQSRNTVLEQEHRKMASHRQQLQESFESSHSEMRETFLEELQAAQKAQSQQFLEELQAAQKAHDDALMDCKRSWAQEERTVERRCEAELHEECMRAATAVATADMAGSARATSALQGRVEMLKGELRDFQDALRQEKERAMLEARAAESGGKHAAEELALARQAMESTECQILAHQIPVARSLLNTIEQQEASHMATRLELREMLEAEAEDEEGQREVDCMREQILGTIEVRLQLLAEELATERDLYGFHAGHGEMLEAQFEQLREYTEERDQQLEELQALSAEAPQQRPEQGTSALAAVRREAEQAFAEERQTRTANVELRHEYQVAEAVLAAHMESNMVGDSGSELKAAEAEVRQLRCELKEQLGAGTRTTGPPPQTSSSNNALLPPRALTGGGGPGGLSYERTPSFDTNFAGDVFGQTAVTADARAPSRPRRPEPLLDFEEPTAVSAAGGSRRASVQSSSVPAASASEKSSPERSRQRQSQSSSGGASGATGGGSSSLSVATNQIGASGGAVASNQTVLALPSSPSSNDDPDSGNNSTATKTSARSVQWMIEIDKSGGESLGVDLHGSSLQIDAVLEGGLFSTWNAANPDKAVCGGDRICEVNGQQASDDIVAEMQECQQLLITISRDTPADYGLAEEAPAQVASPAASPDRGGKQRSSFMAPTRTSQGKRASLERSDRRSVTTVPSRGNEQKPRLRAGTEGSPGAGTTNSQNSQEARLQQRQRELASQRGEIASQRQRLSVSSQGAGTPPKNTGSSTPKSSGSASAAPADARRMVRAGSSISVGSASQDSRSGTSRAAAAKSKASAKATTERKGSDVFMASLR